MVRVTVLALIVLAGVLLETSRRTPTTIALAPATVQRIEQRELHGRDRGWRKADPVADEVLVAALLTGPDPVFDTGELPVIAAAGGKVSRVIACHASWYGEALRGLPTADGTPYDPDGLTAASRTLRLGTVLEVQHADHPERTVRVVVNDRGPWVHTDVRCLDLSKAAFARLDSLGAGVIPVVAYVLEEER